MYNELSIGDHRESLEKDICEEIDFYKTDLKKIERFKDEDITSSYQINVVKSKINKCNFMLYIIRKI